MKRLITGVVALCAVFIGGGSAFGSACSVEPVKDTAWVYKWKFTGKTTYGAKARAASACSAGDTFKASLAGGVMTEICNIIGKKAKNCEVGGTATFTQFVDGSQPAGIYAFTYAGLGKYDRKKGRITSASGNFAGQLNAPVYVDKCSIVDAGFWECGTLALDCDTKPSIMYGKWSVKYQKSASKKYLKNGRLPKCPAWAKHMNQDT